jgi:ribosomal protein L32
MATCPACKSSKVYEGYRRTSLIGRVFRVHEYLCEHCNLQFQAFSLRSPRQKKRRSRSSGDPFSSFIIKYSGQGSASPEPPAAAPPAAASHVSSAAGRPRAEVTAPPPFSDGPPPDGQPEEARGVAMDLAALQEKAQRHRSHRSHHVCPQCGSTDTERRRRRLWERVAFYFSDIRAYVCRICGASFYARRKHKSGS